MTLVPLNDPGECGAADDNGDDVVNEEDIPATIKSIFAGNE